MTRSYLDGIQGIGPRTKEILLKKFGSVEEIKIADIDLLINLIGKSKAEKIRTYFRN